MKRQRKTFLSQPTGLFNCFSCRICISCITQIKKKNTKNSNWALSTKKQDFDNMKLSFCALLKRVLRKKNLKVPNKKQYNTTGKKASQRH